MRNNRLLWGLILLIIGVLLLLQNLGLLSINIWGLLWPLFLILLGAFMIWGLTSRRRPSETRQLSIPAGSAQEAVVSFHHGAGKLYVSAGLPSSEILSGQFEGGVVEDVQQNGPSTLVRLSAPTENMVFPPFGPGSYGYSWDCKLNPDIPMTLEFRTGASESDLDLSGVKATSVRLETGASSTRLVLPANAGLTRASISAGAASLKVEVPDSTAAHIRVKSGLSGINIDTRRFPMTGDGYESTDYPSEINRAEIDIEAGVGSISVR
ncbi:MAG TPA: DUF5668 domain-containing protein [Anaerolineaceae bacterium]|nr:DUF5668 domain-containing protein [Anaerolineaceae bacterium]